MNDTLTCFKAYDVRGKLGSELNNSIAYRIGAAFGVWLLNENQGNQLLKVVIGSDIRLTSPELKNATINGLLDMGIDVIDLGTTGTEEVYFATFHSNAHGGIEITASHNPLDYNGMKLVKEGARPISGNNGLKKIQTLAEESEFTYPLKKGILHTSSYIDAYITHLMTYIGAKSIVPLKLVVNAGNGAAGHIIDALEMQFSNENVPVEFIKINHQPDGTFPRGIPNPLLPDCREDTIEAVLQHNADIGIAWDGDFDRCFLFDEKGNFIEGYYIVGLLAEAFLKKANNEKIIHDPRLTWNTIDIVNANHGTPIQSKTGHAFIKEKMREEDAIYGGEMSAHHYFRDFAYCDSGMIPWLLVIELISKKSLTLSELIQARVDQYPCSGEINFTVTNVDSSIQHIFDHFKHLSFNLDRTDGLSMSFANWRFNLRASNTEPVLRLNVETRNDIQLLNDKTKEISTLIHSSI